MKRILQASSLLALGVALGACDKKESAPPAEEEVVAEEEAPEPEADKIEPTDSVDEKEGAVAVKEGEGDERYQLAIEPPSEVAAGEKGVVKVKVLPQGSWHMNLDYPTSLKVQPPDGVSLTKAEQKKGDAVSFTEETCEFDVAFTPSAAGEKSFTGKFKFAICQEEACSPIQEDIEFQVAVK